MADPIQIINRLKLKNPPINHSVSDVIVRDPVSQEVGSVNKEVFWQPIQDQIDKVNNPDAFLKTGKITQVGSTISLLAFAFEWRKNQIKTTNAADFSTVIAAATDGFYRIDSIYGKTDGTFVKLQGDEDEFNPIPPDPFADGLFLTNIPVFGAVVGEPTEPFVSEIYTKEEKEKLAGLVLSTDENYQPNVLISAVPPTRSVNTFTYPALGYDALINNLRYKNPDDFTTTIAVTATTDLKRTDLIYITTSGVIGKKVGAESTTVAVRPDLTDNEVAISFINVFGNTIETPTAVTKEISIQDAQGNEKFKINDYLRFESVSFNANEKSISIDSLVPLSAFLDIVNGSDLTGALENSKKPFKTIDKLISTLPITTGETYTIYITGGTINVMRPLPNRNLIFNSYSNCIFDFTNQMLDDGVTHSPRVFYHRTTTTIFTYEFIGNNISLINTYEGTSGWDNNLNGNPANTISVKGGLNVVSWKGKNVQGIYPIVLGEYSNISINELICNSSVGLGGLIGTGSNCYVLIKQITYGLIPISYSALIANVHIEINSIVKMATANTAIYLGGITMLFKGSSFTGTLNFLVGTLTFAGVITNASAVNVNGCSVVTGTLVSNVPVSTSWYSVDLLFTNFSGDINNLYQGGTMKFTFNNCKIRVNNSLVVLNNLSSINNVFFTGFNEINQVNTTLNLIATPLSNSYDNIYYNVAVSGEVKTNCLSLGTYINLVSPNITLKEKIKEVVIRSKKDIVNKTLLADCTYIIDGKLDFLEGECIYVPQGGLTMIGYSFDNSVLKTVGVNSSIFRSSPPDTLTATHGAFSLTNYYATPQVGRHVKALEFQGQSAVYAPNCGLNRLFADATTFYSVGFWVKFSNTTSYIVFGTGGPNNGVNYYNVALKINSTNVGVTVRGLETFITITLDKLAWNYVEFKWDGTIFLFNLNGVDYTIPVGTNPLRTYIAGDFMFGGMSQTQLGFNGFIEGVFTYSRARTLAESQASYNSGLGIPYASEPKTSMVSYYSFNQSAGSGNLVLNNLALIAEAVGSKVFDLTDYTGFNAIECNDINFVSCNSLGTLTNYRQFTGTTCGIYSCKDGIQLSGTWSGFKLTNSNIINFIANGIFIKKAITTLFSNRLYLDINFSCQTGAILSDFTDSNFVSDELFQINNTLATLNGSKDATLNTPLLLPNITPSNSKARFTNNLGVINSAIKFQDIKSPDGNAWRLVVDNAGNIITTNL